jgi:Cu/Ag efflux protein CusF
VAEWLTGVARGGAFAVLVATTLAACGGKTTPPAADVYTARGVVEKLPQVNGPDKEIYIHHAAIPGFRDEHGKVVGMMSMTMPFPVTAGVSLAGIAPGDPVEFTFTVAWKEPAGYRIVRLHRLPAGTAVNFQSPP